VAEHLERTGEKVYRIGTIQAGSGRLVRK
jgi:hypothetical protein